MDSRICQTSTASPAEPGGLSFWASSCCFIVMEASSFLIRWISRIFSSFTLSTSSVRCCTAFLRILRVQLFRFYGTLGVRGASRVRKLRTTLLPC